MAAQKGIGRLIQVGVKKEATRGTAETSATHWLPWTDLVLDEKKEFVTDEQSYGIIEDSTNLTQVKKWAQGALTGNVSDTTIGLILYSMFGTYGVTGPTDSAYTHTFTVNQTAQHQSLTVFLHDPLAAVDYSYANAVVEKFELTVALKRFVQYTASLRSLSGASQSNFTPATTTENRFVPQHLTAKFAPTYTGVLGTLTATGTAASTVNVTACSINPLTNLKVGMTVTGTNVPASTTVAALVSSTAFTLSAATTGAVGTMTFGPAPISLRNLKVTITGNVEDQEVLGSVAPADFLNKEFSVEGEFEAIYKNETDFKNDFMGISGGLPRTLAVRFHIKNSDVLIGATSTPELYIDMPQITLLELGRPFKVKDLIYQTVKFNASYQVSNTLLAKMVLINALSTY